MEVIPLLIRKKDPAKEDSKHEFLVGKLGKINAAVMRFQVTAHDTGLWTLNSARETVVNETALALSKMLKNSKERPPPITKWEDASWHLKWVTKENQDASGCIWFAVAEVREGATLCLQKPGKQIWVNLMEELESLVKYREAGGMELLPDNFCPQVMDLPQAAQAIPRSPAKPAMKRNKQGHMDSGGTLSKKGQRQIEDKGECQIVQQGTEGEKEMREDKSICPIETEISDEGN